MAACNNREQLVKLLAPGFLGAGIVNGAAEQPSFRLRSSSNPNRIDPGNENESLHHNRTEQHPCLRVFSIRSLLVHNRKADVRGPHPAVFNVCCCFRWEEIGSVGRNACLRTQTLLTITDRSFASIAADCEQLTPRGRPFAARGIVGEVGRRQVLPRFFDRRNDAPLRLYFVSTRK